MAKSLDLGSRVLRVRVSPGVQVSIGQQVESTDLKSVKCEFESHWEHLGLVLTIGKLGVRNCAVTHMPIGFEVQFFTDPLQGRHLAG